MQNALIFLVLSVSTLVIITGIFRIEDAREGKRVVLVAVRNLFDSFLQKLRSKCVRVDTYLGRGFARLMLHYVAHGVLYRLLAFIARTEDKVEYLLRRNKQVAKEIRTNKQKTHLDVLKEHQKETALTEAQKKKMRSHE